MTTMEVKVEYRLICYYFDEIYHDREHTKILIVNVNQIITEDFIIKELLLDGYSTNFKHNIEDNLYIFGASKMKFIINDWWIEGTLAKSV
jgi:hypothetical protein